jgi:hypothetical protein
MSNTKGLSPLIATILLVIFALIIGIATMSWGKNYVENIPADGQDNGSGGSYLIPMKQVDNNPLKTLQIQYISDKITLDQYLTQEKEAIEKLNQK